MADPAPATVAVQGRYFDGHRAVGHPVQITLEDGRIIVSGDGVNRSEPVEAVTISERIGRTPQFVRFSDGAYCDVPDVDGVTRLLHQTSTPASLVTRLEQSSRAVLAVLITLVVLGGVSYFYGLPMAARVVAERLPPSALDRISVQTLGLLDRLMFDDTRVSLARQEGLRSRFAQLIGPRPDFQYRLEFRSSEALGANAMALPNGTIVVTDGLVNLAGSDDEIMAVVAHEAGHVEERHGLRNVIQSSVVSGLVSWYLGDINTIIAVAPTVLMQTKYSRDLEREADLYAVRLLRENGMSGALLGDMLEKLENEATGRPTADNDSGTYLSSHPSTRERLERLRTLAN